MKTKKVSKKHKSSWRKYIDVSDVDAYLEEERFIERCGQPIEERSNAELFQIDKKPKNLIKESILCPRLKSINQLKLKCYQGLENTSKVADPLIKRNTVRTKDQRQHPTLKKKNEIRLRRGILKRKEISQLQKIFFKRMRCLEQKSRRRVTADKDLWEDKNPNESKLCKVKPWLDDRTFLHTVKNTSFLKNESIYRPENTKSVVDSFEPPHPGTSYNPTYEDHINLANNIAEVELKTQKEEAHLTRVTQKFFKQVTVAKNEENWINEMSEGLPRKKTELDEVNDAEGDGIEFKAINPPVSREKKKTKKQRKKELRLKTEELKKKEIIEQKKKAADINRISDIMQEILREEVKTNARSLKRLQKSANKFECARRTGRNKYVPIEPSISLVEELTGSLREIIPQGSVLKDKMNNMQKRNIVEITKPQFKKKKKKLRKYRLGSHRPGPIEFSRNDLLKMVTK